MNLYESMKKNLKEASIDDTKNKVSVSNEGLKNYLHYDNLDRVSINPDKHEITFTTVTADQDPVNRDGYLCATSDFLGAIEEYFYDQDGQVIETSGEGESAQDGGSFTITYELGGNIYESAKKTRIPKKLKEADGWIAFFGDKKVEITKDEAKDLWGAKQVAIRKLNVPKSKTSLVAVEPAYNEDNLDNAPASNAQFESCSKKARVPKKLKEASETKTFTVIIEETVSQKFEIEAEDDGDAMNKAIEKYKNGEIVLEPGELVSASVANYDPETGDTSEFVEIY